MVKFKHAGFGAASRVEVGKRETDPAVLSFPGHPGQYNMSAFSRRSDPVLSLVTWWCSSITTRQLHQNQQQTCKPSNLKYADAMRRHINTDHFSSALSGFFFSLFKLDFPSTGNSHNPGTCDKVHFCPLAGDTRAIAEAVQMGSCLFALVSSPSPHRSCSVRRTMTRFYSPLVREGLPLTKTFTSSWCYLLHLFSTVCGTASTRSSFLSGGLRTDGCKLKVSDL